MKRSGGVTASAVIAFIGSGLSILFGSLTVVSAIMIRVAPNLPSTNGQPVPTIPPAALLLTVSLFYAGLGAWGIVSSVGLLRLRNWARICFLVFAGLLSVMSFFGAIVSLVAMLIIPKTISTGQNVPAGLITGVFPVFFLVAFLLTALGVSWLVYFNRRDVKSQFLGEEEVAAPRIFPLSITIIGWILVVGGLAIPLGLLSSYPVIVLGFVLRGWSARLVLFTFGLVSLLAGNGMLRRRPEAHSLAVAYYFFGLLNLVSYLAFGSVARMLEITEETSPNPAVTAKFIYPFLRFAILFGLWARPYSFGS